MTWFVLGKQNVQAKQVYWSNFNSYLTLRSQFFHQPRVFVFVDTVDAENSRESRSSQAKN